MRVHPVRAQGSRLGITFGGVARARRVLTGMEAGRREDRMWRHCAVALDEDPGVALLYEGASYIVGESALVKVGIDTTSIISSWELTPRDPCLLRHRFRRS